MNAIYLKELEINHLYVEIKEKVMKRDNLQLLLLLIARGICTSITKDTEMGGNALADLLPSNAYPFILRFKQILWCYIGSLLSLSLTVNFCF